MTALWHPPSLRRDQPQAGHPAVSWTELFYDLVFVEAVASLAPQLVGASVRGFGAGVGLFAMLWWAWASLTFVVDRYESNDVLDRLLAVGQMLGVAAFAAAVSREGGLEAAGPMIAAAYVVTRLTLLALYARAWRSIPESRELVTGYLRGFGADTALWAASIFTPAPWRYVLWALAMTISVATPWLMRRIQVRSPLNTSHLPERFGLFTILVLGEPVAAAVVTLRADSLHVIEPLAAAAATFMVAAGLWWMYFENFEGSVVRRDPNRLHDWRPTAWIYAHLPLTLAVAALGHAMAHVMDHPEGHATSGAAGIALGVTLCSMALILVSTAGGDRARRHRRALARVAGAVAAFVLALATPSLGGLAVLGLLGAIVVAGVLFDIADAVVAG